MTTNPSVLISGAGVGGTTLAYWLARRGFRVTVVERSAGLRSSGNPVDVRGPAVAVVEGMGVLGALRAAATDVTALSFVNGSGREVGRVNLRAMQRASGSQEVEVTRTDLAGILYDAGRDAAEFLFGDTITALSQDGDGVDVTFRHAAPRRFDVVVGADGLHSTTRRLAFGSESEFVRHMGLFVATLQLGQPAERDREVVLYNAPGRLASIHPVRGEALAAFIFRAPMAEDFDYRDLEQHKRLVATAYADAGWQVPQLLDRVRTTDDIWLDSVSQVRIDRWAEGRLSHHPAARPGAASRAPPVFGGKIKGV